jgi:BASS family bile acid:Na+ symporter
VISPQVGVCEPHPHSPHRARVPILIFVMTLSMTSITTNLFRDPARWVKPILVSLTLNYLVLGSVIILLAYLLGVSDQSRIGYIVLAATPPAVAVIPFTGFLGGEHEYSLVGFTVSYLAAFLFTPLILGFFFEAQSGFQDRIFVLLFELVVIPFLLSRLVIRSGLVERVNPFKGALVNWSFFLIIYSIVGLNHDVFLSEPLSLIPLAGVSFGITFVLGSVIYWVGERLSVEPRRLVSMVLLGTSKNSGFAAGIALVLFGAETTVPSTVTTIFMLLYAIFLDIVKR